MRMSRALSALIPALLIAACSGGAGTEENPVTSNPPVAEYTGPAPANADVQAFRVSLWENIKSSARCGGCHGADGQAPTFARNDDINLAYQAAVALANLSQPDQSRLVVKVAGGHNCWLQSASACADTITVWIRNWAGETAVGGRLIELQAPPIREVGASRSFPPDSALFSTTVHPLLTEHCSRCHSSSAATQQSPFFASAGADEAYAAVREKINLDNPELSRLVVRLRQESHNCWSNCASDANTMQAAIQSFADGIPITEVDSSLILSKALRLYDGTVAAGGNRYDNNVVALYEFKTGSGAIAYDTSGVEPALNLTLSGNVQWVGGWGINIGPGGKAQGPTTASRKLASLIKSTGEFTIEAWAAPANVMQEDAFIVSYSGGPMTRNATLAQRAYQYEAMVRSDRASANGAPSLLTAADDRDAQATLQHVVLTYDPVNGRRLYVNGAFTEDLDSQGGSLADWDDSFAFVLGNETSNDRQWQGVLRLVAVHNRALTAAQVQQNYDAGVGERYYLLFSVGHLVDVPQSYLMLEASQLDSYGYLFTRPTFISLDSNARPDGIAIRGLRIGINGAEARVGQAYAPLDSTVSGSSYVPGVGQPLTSIGTVIGLEKGPAADEFFVSFEQIGSHSRLMSDGPPPAPDVPADLGPQPDIGVRTFDEINATLSEITGVPVTTPAVAQTYDTIRQQLPTVKSIDAFLASHQVAVAQLAIEYCNALVDDSNWRGSFFPGLDVSQQAGTYFSIQGNRDRVIDPLLNKAIGANLSTQPTASEVRAELNALITNLTAGAAGAQQGRTAVVAKAACAAVLGSGTTLLH